MFEQAARRGISRVAYASSAAVYERDDEVRAGRAPGEEQAPHPNTHYGVYKLCNEGTARVSFLEHGISSIGLRPLTVYGVGRDQGLTSGPTRAMKAAVIGRAFHIPFSGATDFKSLLSLLPPEKRPKAVTLKEAFDTFDEVAPPRLELRRRARRMAPAFARGAACGAPPGIGSRAPASVLLAPSQRTGQAGGSAPLALRD